MADKPHKPAQEPPQGTVVRFRLHKGPTYPVRAYTVTGDGAVFVEYECGTYSATDTGKPYGSKTTAWRRLRDGPNAAEARRRAKLNPIIGDDRA